MRNIKLSFRRLKENSTSVVLGTAGLAAGLVCVMYIFLWINNAVMFDRGNEKIDRIFRVHGYYDTMDNKFGGCPPAVGPALVEELPQVESTCRLIPEDWMEASFKYGDKIYNECFCAAEFSIFNILTFHFVDGGVGTESIANKMVIDQTIAAKYFGTESPVGKIILVDNQEFTVVGVIEDIPTNNTIHSKIFVDLIPVVKYHYSVDDNYFTTWYNNGFLTIGLLQNAADLGTLEEYLEGRIQKELPESKDHLRAYMFKRTHLYEEKVVNVVLVYAIIGIFILIAAILNFINLNTARSIKQAREIGIRKIIGSAKSDLVKMVYTDITVLCGIAFIVAGVFTISTMKVFFNFIGMPIELSAVTSPLLIGGLTAIFVITIIFSGIYSAFFLTNISPLKIVSGNYRAVKNRGFFRQIFVVVILIISIVMSIGITTISKQISYIQNLKLGLNPTQIVGISLNGSLSANYEAVRDEILKNVNVKSACVCTSLPSNIGQNGNGISWEGKPDDLDPLVSFWFADENAFDVFEFKLIEGQPRKNGERGVYINKTLADIIGWDTFEGKELVHWGDKSPILGVIEDFRFGTFSQTKQPLIIFKEWQKNVIAVKFESTEYASTLEYISEICSKREPNLCFDYVFLDENYAKTVENEKSMRKLIGTFSIFIFIVLCLGLLGTIMFTAEQKIKEIGIRKCLGESVGSLILRFIKPFIISGVIASAVAVPLAYYVMNKWLETYTEHTTLSPIMLTIIPFITIMITAAVVTYQSIVAANRNPVEALKHE